MAAERLGPLGPAARDFLPDLKRLEEAERDTPADLLAKLPPGVVLVDFVLYQRMRYEADPKGKRVPRPEMCYLAFVLGRPKEGVSP